jgi:Secretion system C-terminal sorting domain/Electron transfer DM13
MKIFTFLLLFTFGLSQFAYTQCTTSTTGFGNNTSVPMYNVQGTVQVVLNTNNTVTVNLMSNFATAAGPDVRIFLVDRGTLTNAQLKVTSNFLNRPRIEMGLSPASGMASFTKTIPVGMNISDFETVYFYCQAFSQFWDYGSFTPFTTTNCALLGTSNFENNTLQLYPNPATDELNFQLEDVNTDYKIAIYNTLGSLLYESTNQVSNSTNSINISHLNSGIYLVQITDSENRIYQKRLIKK